LHKARIKLFRGVFIRKSYYDAESSIHQY